MWLKVSYFFGSIFFLGLSVSGCAKQPMTPDILPNNRDDVPVNAVVKIRYVGDSFLQEAQLKKKDKGNKFKLVTCEETSTSSTATAQETTKSSGDETSSTEEQTKEQPDQKKEDKTNPTTPTDVLGYVTWKRLGGKTESGKEVKITDIYFIPQSLEPDTHYCFTVDEMAIEGKRDKLAPAGTAVFRTEENASFEFNAEPQAILIPSVDPGEKSSPPTKAIVLVDFDGSGPANPLEVEKGLHLCSKDVNDGASDSSGSCGSSGVPEKRTVYLLEPLEEDPETKLVLANFTAYAVQGAPLVENVRYVVKSDVGSGRPVNFDLKNLSGMTSWSKTLENLKIPSNLFFIQISS